MTMTDMTVTNGGREVEQPRGPKGYTWIPVDAQTKKERKWTPI